MKNVMVDLETLGTAADAVIISIGAVAFEMEGDIADDGFYASVSIDSNLELGRKIDESTLVWWMGQDPAAQAVFNEPKMTLIAALTQFQDWYLGHHGGASVWSNGASFDVPMLEHAFKQLQLDTPWNYFDSQCVRTYRKLPGADKVPRPKASVAHNALADAMAQAQYVQAIHKALFVKGKVTA